jgi:hypothetical protein
LTKTVPSIRIEANMNDIFNRDDKGVMSNLFDFQLLTAIIDSRLPKNLKGGDRKKLRKEAQHLEFFVCNLF